MTSLAQPDPQNAPRDLLQLSKMGRFQLRKLAEQLGIIVSNSDKPEDAAQLTAYMTMNTETQAQSILQALLELDKGGGAPATAAAAPAPAPAPTPAPAVNGLRRTPVTANGAGNPGFQAPAAPAPVAASVDLSPVLAALGTLAETQKTLLGAMKDLKADIAELKNHVAVSTTTSLLIGETALNASRGDILDSAIADANGIINLIAEATKGGKGKGK